MALAGEHARTDAPLPRRHSPLPSLIEFGKQLAFILFAVVLYFGVRGLTPGNVDVAVQNGPRVLEFEARLGINIEEWAQSLIIDHQWLVDLANGVYIWGHWPVITVILVWLHQTRRTDYLLLRNAMFISGGIGLFIFATYAVAPPRLLDTGLFLDTVSEHSNAYRVLQPPGLVNKYAAIPSLHVGWNLLVGIALYRASSRKLLRLLAVLSPLLMAIAVVVTANHYVIDGIIGSGLALLGLAVASVLTPRMVEFDAWLRQLRQNHRRVKDQPVESPLDEPERGLLVRDRPAEDAPEAALELCYHRRGEQATVDDDSVDSCP